MIKALAGLIAGGLLIAPSFGQENKLPGCEASLPALPGFYFGMTLSAAEKLLIKRSQAGEINEVPQYFETHLGYSKTGTGTTPMHENVVLSFANAARRLTEYRQTFSLPKDEAKALFGALKEKNNQIAGNEGVMSATFSEYQAPAQGNTLRRWDWLTAPGQYLYLDEDFLEAEAGTRHVSVQAGCGLDRLKR